MMWLTTMSPDSRRLIKVLPTDAERTSAVFDLLLGDNLQGPQGAHRRARRGVSGRSGRELIRARRENTPTIAARVGAGHAPPATFP